jgi:hypothetical protein
MLASNMFLGFEESLVPVVDFLKSVKVFNASRHTSENLVRWSGVNVNYNQTMGMPHVARIVNVCGHDYEMRHWFLSQILDYVFKNQRPLFVRLSKNHNNRIVLLKWSVPSQCLLTSTGDIINPDDIDTGVDNVLEIISWEFYTNTPDGILDTVGVIVENATEADYLSALKSLVEETTFKIYVLQRQLQQAKILLSDLNATYEMWSSERDVQ